VIDSVISLHMNPETCGVGKFNGLLADRLGVPHRSVYRWREVFGRPLLSLKASEYYTQMNEEGRCCPFPPYPRSFDVLWHDAGIPEISERADHVWYARDLGCPSTLRGDPTRKGLTILSYGMAHKLQQPLFEKLKSLLDAHGQPYTVCVSSAIHEGSPWDATTKEHTARLRSIFGDHLRWLGFLADDALAREIREAHTVALFYDPAVRANNTTLWAALDAGTPVVTNLDAQSPKELQHGVSVLDIHQLTEWPDYNGDRQELRAGGHKAAAAYSWDRLIEKLTAVHV